MTDMITVSRKEIEALQRWQDDKEIANNCYEDDDGYFILYDDLRALLDKAEVVSGEPICNLWVCPATLYYKVDRGEHHNSDLIPVYTTPQPSRIKEIEALQAREKVLVDAISRSLNCIREEINLNNYTETLLGDFISYYGDMVIILQQALANVRGE